MHKVLKEFLEQTKFVNLSTADAEKGAAAPDLDSPTPPGDIIDLPSQAGVTVSPTPLREAMENRRSRRAYLEQELTLEQLSWLLWACQGVQVVQSNSTLRMVPSAGSRHPLDTYLVINRVSGLKSGLYKYLPLSHQLVLVREDKEISMALDSVCRRKWVRKAPVAFIWAAVPYRATWKYSERAWRYMFIEAGHTCQNLYLACEAIGAGCCGVEAFDDDAMNQFLDLDGDNSFALYMAPVGLL